MNPHVMLNHDYATANPALVRSCEGRDFPDLKIELFHSRLAEQLGFTESDVLSLVTAGGHAMAYAGHQFGQFVPILGDGRALLLGEVATDSGLIDIHVKGTGRTPFSRNGDGLYPLDAAKKEYLFSWALAALDIPTSQVLAVLSTGESVRRRTLEPGALVVRVASSHMRVGTFQFAALTGEETLRGLADYAIGRHYPGSSYSEFFQLVMENQAKLVAEWMRLGFLHGVINTDNTTISGESIDFGPCAWAESFNPNLVFSSIDTTGRYRFGYQPEVVGWNLARLVECLVPLVDLAQAQELINGYPRVYQQAWQHTTSRALGFTEPSPVITELVNDLYAWLQRSGWDTATTLRALAEDTDFDCTELEWQLWVSRFNALEPDPELMLRHNPVFLPRNHLVAAAAKDEQLFSQLLEVLANPYQRQDSAPKEFTSPSSEKFLSGFRTFCGT